jgi:hypothetical protein
VRIDAEAAKDNSVILGNRAWYFNVMECAPECEHNRDGECSTCHWQRLDNSSRSVRPTEVDGGRPMGKHCNNGSDVVNGESVFYWRVVKGAGGPVAIRLKAIDVMCIERRTGVYDQEENKVGATDGLRLGPTARLGEFQPRRACGYLGHNRENEKQFAERISVNPLDAVKRRQMHVGPAERG